MERKMDNNNDNCCVDFEEYLGEYLKVPENKEGYERAGKILDLENQLNELLRTMGINDMFVEVKDMSEY